jgi:hypothetical protein
MRTALAIACVILLAIIVWLWWIRAKNTDRIEQENIELAAKNDSLRVVAVEILKKRYADSVENKVAQKRFNKEIEGLGKEVTRLKALPVVVRVREEVPEVDTLIRVLEVRDTTQAREIERLNRHIARQDMIFNSVIGNMQQQIANTNQVNSNLQYVNSVLRAENKKTKVFGKIGIAVGVVGLGYGILK